MKTEPSRTSFVSGSPNTLDCWREKELRWAPWNPLSRIVSLRKISRTAACAFHATSVLGLRQLGTRVVWAETNGVTDNGNQWTKMQRRQVESRLTWPESSILKLTVRKALDDIPGFAFAFNRPVPS